MIVIMRASATDANITAIQHRLEEYQLQGRLIRGEERTIIGVVGAAIPPTLQEEIERFEGVQETARITRPYKLAAREFHPHDTIVDVRGVKVGDGSCVVIAGPCAVESADQILSTARAAREAGANMLRGGAFKPRSSPYTFRGMGEEALKLMAQARAETGLPIVTEVMTPTDVALVARYADVLQIGARNMQNYGLLHAVGRIQRPVLLKRGLMSTIEELLMSAEYILSNGNYRVMLCERGIRTFETYTRNTFDLNAVPVLKQLSHLPVIADPSHGTGKWELVTPMARAAIAAGADGLILEVHPAPEVALSDGAQSLKPEKFVRLMQELKRIAAAMDRDL